jgi:hypothetical protein
MGYALAPAEMKAMPLLNQPLATSPAVDTAAAAAPAEIYT